MFIFFKQLGKWHAICNTRSKETEYFSSFWSLKIIFKLEIRVSQNLLGGGRPIECQGWKRGRELKEIVKLGRAGFNTGSNIGRWDLINLYLVGVNLNPVLWRWKGFSGIEMWLGLLRKDRQCFIGPKFTPFHPPICVITVKRKWVRCDSE